MTAFPSVLVVRLSALGDVLFALPAVQALVASGLAGRLAWVVEPGAAALLEGLDGLDEIIRFPRRDHLAVPGHLLRLRRRRDDLVLDLQGNLKSRMHLMALRAPRKLGFDAPLAREGAEKGLTERFLPPGYVKHRVAANVALVESLGVEVPRPIPRPVLRLGAGPGASADATDAAGGDVGGRDGGRPRVVLHPGTSTFGQLKRWAPERFAALGDALAREHGAELLVTGGPGEEQLVAAVRGALHAPSSAPATGGLDGLARLLRGADLVVAADSLPLHLANALGTPVVGLYGPKDPRVTGPFFDRARVVRADVQCSPCTLRRCRDRVCMEQLAVETARAACAELLEGAPC